METASSSVNLQFLGSEQPLLQVMISEENPRVLIQPHQNETIKLNLSDSSTSDSANVLEAAATLVECGNVHSSNTRRDVQIDEEDVASLLANQFAKEAVYMTSNSPSNNSSGMSSS